MGIVEFFGLRPPPGRGPVPQPVPMQDLGLDDAGRQRLEEARRAVEEASVHDHDEAIALLARAAGRLAGIARQAHPHVVELREEIDTELTERAGALREAAEADLDRWGHEWTDCAADPADSEDKGERDARLARVGRLVEDLRAGLKRHDAALQRLRGTPAEHGVGGLGARLATARETLTQAGALAGRLEQARRQAALLEALQDARRRCVEACSNESGSTGVKLWMNLKGDVDEIIGELESPDELEPAQAAREAERLIGELDALSAKIVAHHNATLKAELGQRLRVFRERMGRTGFKIDADALQRLEARIALLDARKSIDTSKELEQAVADVELDAYYAERAQVTQKGKLPVIDAARERHEGVATAMSLEDLVQRMVPGRMGGGLGPGPLGEAKPNYEGSTWPEVKLVPAGGNQVSFAPTQAREGGAHTCFVTPFGEHDIGLIDMVDGTSVSVFVEGTLYTFRDVAGAKKAWQGRMLCRGVTPECYQQIELRELEHLVDFSHAFAIAAGRLAAAVQALAGKPFGSADAALKALIAELGDALTLVPEDPRDPAAWARRIRLVTTLLAGFSTDRDDQGTHSPAGNVAREHQGAIVIEPEFKTASLDTAKIISLDRIDPVFTSLGSGEEGDLWALKTLRRTKDRVRADFCDAVSGNEVLMDFVPAGAEVSIESKPAGGQVWLGATAASLKIADGIYLKNETRVYFRMSTKHIA